jgi:hypothetical protein
MHRLSLAFGLIASLAGCATQTGPACAPGFGAPVAVFTLFMGKAIPGRDDLTDNEWRSFVDDTVSVNLPNGFTVFDANGGWRNPLTNRTAQEGTKVLLVALPDSAESRAAVNRVRHEYQLRFRQQLVGMTVENACATF